MRASRYRHFRNLHALTLADRQIADARAGIDDEAEAFRKREQLAPGGGGVGAQPPEPLGPRHDVFEHAQIVGECEMLVHHADAGGDGRARPSARQFAAEHEDAALVRRIMAKQDIHQRGLAGAVLAEQREHLAPSQRQADVVIGEQRAETLGDALQPEDQVAHAAKPAIGAANDHGRACSSARAARSSEPSEPIGPTSWTGNGRPSESTPCGMVSAGVPAALASAA